MAKLAKVEDTIIRGGFNSNLANLPTILAAQLEAATTHLETSLRTRFDRNVDFEDRFYVDSEEYPFKTGKVKYGRVGLQQVGFIKLYHSNGWIDTATTFTVTRAFTLGDLDLVGASTIDATFIQTNHAAGLTLITGADPVTGAFIEPRLDKEYVKLTYTSGFTTVNEGPPNEDLYQNVPTELKELAMLTAIKLYSMSGACAKGDKALCQAMCSPLAGLMERYIRFYPSALKPLLWAGG